MKNIFSIILIFCSIEIYSQSWNIETTLPGEYNRRAGISAVVGNKAYTGLGIASNFNSGYGENTVADFWSYDMNSKTWAQLPSFPGGGRCDAAAFVIGTKIYVGGGDVNVKFTNPNQGLYASEFYSFETTTSTWTQIANLPQPLGESFSFAINGKGFVTCGQGNGQNGYRKVLYSYDPATDQWAAKANFPGVARSYPIGFVINNQAYVGGGYAGFWYGSYPDGITPAYHNDFYSYDPSTDVWTPRGTTSNGVDGSGVIAAAVGISTCDKGYIIFGNYNPWSGGGYSVCCSSNLLEYDPVNNSWIVKASLPITLSQATGWQYNGVLYAGLGIYAGNSEGGTKVYSYKLYNIVSSSNPICSSSNQSITNKPSGATVIWSSGQTNALTIDGSGLATRANNSNATVLITATISGCPNSIPIYSNIYVGTGISDPLIEQKTIFCYDASHYSILGRVTEAPLGSTYKWYIGSSSGTNYVLKTTSTGNSATVEGGVVDNLYHTLKVDITNSCGSIVSTSRPEGRFKASCSGGGGANLMAAPNPVSTKLTVQFGSTQEAETYQSLSSAMRVLNRQVSIARLYNSNGMLCGQVSDEGHDPSIDVSYLPNGLYTLKLELESGVTTQLIVVKH
ncbi:hypothetical protein BH09BAC3_BH09BAC3_03690 [soil metagenome]